MIVNLSVSVAPLPPDFFRLLCAVIWYGTFVNLCEGVCMLVNVVGFHSALRLPTSSCCLLFINIAVDVMGSRRCCVGRHQCGCAGCVSLVGCLLSLRVVPSYCAWSLRVRASWLDWLCGVARA